MIINYSYYPILKGALTHHIKEFDEQEIMYAFEHIEKYTPTKLLDLDLSVWLVSMIMLRCVNNSYLTRKFVSNYGKYTFEHRTMKDFLNKETRMEILEYFGIYKDVLFETVSKEPFIKIHCMDYLELLEQGLSIQAPQFHLVNQVMDKGFVYIEFSSFIYLLRIACEHRLLMKIRSMKEYKDNKLINKLVEELKIKYPIEEKSLPIINNSLKEYPPCISVILSKVDKESYLNHNERILISTYFNSKGYSNEWLSQNIFEKLSDYSKRITDYQLKYLEKYKIKNCSTINTEGLCFRNSSCRNITNPFFF